MQPTTASPASLADVVHADFACLTPGSPGAPGSPGLSLRLLFRVSYRVAMQPSCRPAAAHATIEPVPMKPT